MSSTVLQTIFDTATRIPVVTHVLLVLSDAFVEKWYMRSQEWADITYRYIGLQKRQKTALRSCLGMQRDTLIQTVQRRDWVVHDRPQVLLLVLIMLIMHGFAAAPVPWMLVLFYSDDERVFIFECCVTLQVGCAVNNWFARSAITRAISQLWTSNFERKETQFFDSKTSSWSRTRSSFRYSLYPTRSSLCLLFM